MTFDPYANQGDMSADPEAAAATKRVADQIFAGDSDGAAEGDSADTAEYDTTEAENPSGEGEGTAVKQDPHAPESVPDPDIATDP